MLGAKVRWEEATNTVTVTEKGWTGIQTSFDATTLHFPTNKYPETAAHIKAAIDKGESSVCTIKCSASDKDREASLKGIPTKDGYDRDEWPIVQSHCSWAYRRSLQSVRQ